MPEIVYAVQQKLYTFSDKSSNSGFLSVWCAPELWKKQEPGSFSDQYSLAVMAWYLYSGTFPFEEKGVQLLNAVMKKYPVPLDFLPDYVNCALLRALDKDPLRRFPSCSDFMKAISDNAASENIPKKRKPCNLPINTIKMKIWKYRFHNVFLNGIL